MQYYPKDGESMEDAVNREVVAARTTAGLLDASTLGKIDIKGPDAAEFLTDLHQCLAEAGNRKRPRAGSDV